MKNAILIAFARLLAFFLLLALCAGIAFLATVLDRGPVPTIVPPLQTEAPRYVPPTSRPAQAPETVNLSADEQRWALQTAWEQTSAEDRTSICDYWTHYPADAMNTMRAEAPWLDPAVGTIFFDRVCADQGTSY